MNYIKKNPETNAYNLTKDIKIHIVTAQRILDTMEKYGFVKSQEKKGIGRPSKIYSYIGGEFKINLNELLNIYQSRLLKIREAGNPEITFSYDIDKEIINAILIKGKTGKKIKIDESRGKLLWLIPPPDSKGENIEVLAKKANISIIDSILFIKEMINLKVIEEVQE